MSDQEDPVWDSQSEPERPRISFKHAIQTTRRYLARILQRQRESDLAEGEEAAQAMLVDDQPELPDEQLRERLSIATRRINSTLAQHIAGDVPEMPPDQAHQAQPAPPAAPLPRRPRPLQRRAPRGKGKGKGKTKSKGKSTRTSSQPAAAARNSRPGTASTGRMLGPTEYWAAKAKAKGKGGKGKRNIVIGEAGKGKGKSRQSRPPMMMMSSMSMNPYMTQTYNFPQEHQMMMGGMGVNPYLPCKGNPAVAQQMMMGGMGMNPYMPRQQLQAR